MKAPADTTEEWLETVVCPICGVDDCTVVYPSRRTANAVKDNEFRPSGDMPLEDPLVRCRRCAMQYVNPRLPSDVVLEGYASAVDETFVSQAAGREQTFKRCLDMLQSVWRRPSGSLLDIGTANGSFLKVARDAGWKVRGCEPNRWLCRWCEEHYGILLTPGTVFDACFPSGSFDIITLWDVLEHTPDPLVVLRECERLLAPGGLLAVNYPDIGSLVARV
ncbi:MAG: class I SAM-dependent methyltransferase, partial [Deltaproteobacteria bacterium]|nr:class I SAM-dependent methyltransferase [Deltaproteobacteria bacterium]